MTDLNSLRDSLHAIAKEKGWWEQNYFNEIDPIPNIPEKLALIHSEISEALEDYRIGMMNVVMIVPHPETGEPNKPTGFPIELADVIIRILDLCGYLKIDIEAAVREKAEYNRTRPYRHGNKKA